MRAAIVALTAFFAVAAARPAHADIPILSVGDLSLDAGAMAQVYGVAQYVPDPYRSPEELFLFLKEGRLRLDGGWRDYRLHVEMSLGGESTIGTTTPATWLGLLDLYATLPLHFLGRSFLRVGQFKVPYSREQLTYSGDLLFADRSINQPAFVVGRDIGGSVNLRLSRATVLAGVFTGGGRDIPAEYLPQKLGVPLFVLRAGVGNLDDDPYVLTQSQEVAEKRTRWAVFVDALYMRDSLVGHSSVLNVKLADRSLLLNPAWNPFIGAKPLSQGDWLQVGGDAALRQALPHGLRFEAELEGNYSRFSNSAGTLAIWGGRVQAALGWRGLEFAARYAFVMPDSRFAFVATTPAGAGTTTPITPNGATIHEITPALSYRFFGERFKVIADLPILVDAPVFAEPNVGTYVGTEMPQQASVLGGGGSVSRQTVIAARLLLQGRF
jgi:hypothetical protein